MENPAENPVGLKIDGRFPRTYYSCTYLGAVASAPLSRPSTTIWLSANTREMLSKSGEVNMVMVQNMNRTNPKNQRRRK
jgi:hypothetical protein